MNTSEQKGDKRMMDINQLAREIRAYYESTRRVGHTKAVIDGALSSNAVVVCGNQKHADEIAKQFKVDTVTIQNVSRLPQSRPIVWDNFAVVTLLGMVSQRFDKILDDKRKECCHDLCRK